MSSPKTVEVDSLHTLVKNVFIAASTALTDKNSHEFWFSDEFIINLLMI